MLRMKLRTSAILVLMLLVGAPVLAKGVTVEIVVSAADSADSLSITHPDVVQQFSIWSGPNSRWRVKDGDWQTDYSRIYMDFPGGAVDAPSTDAQLFHIEFHIASTPGDEPWDETYHVRYALEPTEAGGYFYLPAGNPLIHHGVEGNWFRSTDSWEDSVRPLIVEWLDALGAENDTD